MKFDAYSKQADSRALEKIVAPDKGICVKLLRAANSSFYGRAGKITSMRDAITLMGLQGTKSLILMLSFRNMKTDLKGPIYNKYLTEYPVLSALTAQDLAKHVSLPNIRDEAFLCALLHKIGMTVIAMEKKDHYALLIEETERKGYNLIELERESYRTDHDQVSTEAFAAWRLTEPMQNVIASLNFKVDATEKQSDLTRLTVLGAVIAGKFICSDLTENPFEKEARILDYYKASPATREYFGASYYETIKKHPFYELALAQ